MYICMYVSTHVHVFAHVFIHIHACMHAYIQLHGSMLACIYISLYICTSNYSNIVRHGASPAPFPIGPLDKTLLAEVLLQYTMIHDIIQ